MNSSKALPPALQPSVGDYFDYRRFLGDFYRARKESDPTFSHRAFLAQASIPGSVYLLRVIEGRRKLSPKYIPNFTRALGLSGREATYFSHLVHFCNAKPGQEKEQRLREMMQIRYASPRRRIEDRKLRFFEKWYVPIIRELVTILPFNEDYNLLASLVIPRISAVQAKGAVAYLVKNGFIHRRSDGSYAQQTPTMTTGDEVNSTILRKYHRRVLLQCAEALDTVKPENRDVSSLTLTVSREDYVLIKKEIQQFRKRLLQFAENVKTPEMVCLIGMQLLPRTKNVNRKSGA